MIDRGNVAKCWQARASLTRAAIFADADLKLRPTAMPTQVDVSVPGMVGDKYNAGGLAIVSVNPAGGRDGFRPTAGDDRLYKAAASLRVSEGIAAFEELNSAFVAGMPTWGPQWRVIDSILCAARQRLPQIAYPYLVPFRSRGDAGSALPRTVLDRSYRAGFPAIVAALAPRFLIAVDRPSERACLQVREELALNAEVIYFTRKRDAHAERTATLQVIASRTG